MTSQEPSLQQALKQALAHWQSAGIRQLPQADPQRVSTVLETVQQLAESASASSVPEAPVEVAKKPTPKPAPVREKPASSPRPSTGTSGTGGGMFGPRKRTSDSQNISASNPVSQTPQSSSPMPVVPPNTSACKLKKAERQQELDSLAQLVSQCSRCQELAAERTQTVFGVGNPKSTVMFIGEAPGADEDKQGEPFVGRAGKLLTKIIEACGWKREQLYICNILRCRPPGNRNPSPEEAQNCREYLDGQIKLVDPKYIVCWGTIAAQNLLGEQQPIGRMRGKFYEFGRAKVLCTYHPSYLLRNPSAKKHVWEDLKILLREMDIDPEALQQ